MQFVSSISVNFADSSKNLRWLQKKRDLKREKYSDSFLYKTVPSCNTTVNSIEQLKVISIIVIMQQVVNLDKLLVFVMISKLSFYLKYDRELAYKL